MVIREKIAGLIFDLGGVVFNIDFDRALHVWTRYSRLSFEEMRHRFKMDETYEKHERGEIGASEYFNHLRLVLDLEVNDTDIAIGWNAIFLDEISETVNYIRKAKEKLPCFAFTNSNPTHQSAWMAAYVGAAKSFDQIFVSSDLGVRKPEIEAYLAISNEIGIGIDRLLFFDDTIENVDGARAAGMQAVHVKTHIDVKHALNDIGVI